jgi:hypothetical protein
MEDMKFQTTIRYIIDILMLLHIPTFCRMAGLLESVEGLFGLVKFSTNISHKPASSRFSQYHNPIFLALCPVA